MRCAESSFEIACAERVDGDIVCRAQSPMGSRPTPGIFVPDCRRVRALVSRVPA
jgi:hypothetical protein